MGDPGSVLEMSREDFDTEYPTWGTVNEHPPLKQYRATPNDWTTDTCQSNRSN